MTRLTNELRSAIVAKIMSKVPNTDYIGKTKEFLNAAARSLAPPEISALEGTPEWQYVSVAKVYISGEGYYNVCPLPSTNNDTLKPTHPIKPWRDLWDAYEKSGLHGAHERQFDAHRNMRSKLMQVMKSTSTVEGLRKVLSPDLHEFVPITVESSANLPVPAVVAELKAMGMQFPETTPEGNK